MGKRLDDYLSLKEMTDNGSLPIFAGIPEMHAGYRPRDGMMNFAEQLHHVAALERSIVGKIHASLKKGKMPPELSAGASVSDEVTALKETWGITRDLLTAMQDDDLDVVIDFPEDNWKIPARRLLHVLVEHQVHHRGQIIVYFRTLGLDPPKRWQE